MWVTICQNPSAKEKRSENKTVWWLVDFCFYMLTKRFQSQVLPVKKSIQKEDYEDEEPCYDLPRVATYFKGIPCQDSYDSTNEPNFEKQKIRFSFGSTLKFHCSYLFTCVSFLFSVKVFFIYCKNYPGLHLFQVLSRIFSRTTSTMLRLTLIFKEYNQSKIFSEYCLIFL